MICKNKSNFFLCIQCVVFHSWYCFVKLFTVCNNTFACDTNSTPCSLCRRRLKLRSCQDCREYMLVLLPPSGDFALWVVKWFFKKKKLSLVTTPVKGLGFSSNLSIRLLSIPSWPCHLFLDFHSCEVYTCHPCNSEYGPPDLEKDLNISWTASQGFDRNIHVSLRISTFIHAVSLKRTSFPIHVKWPLFPSKSW